MPHKMYQITKQSMDISINIITSYKKEQIKTEIKMYKIVFVLHLKINLTVKLT